MRLTLVSIGALIALGGNASLFSNLTAQRPDSSQEHTSPAVFRGRVLGPNGAPIADADVWLILIDMHTVTDSAGAFQMSGLAAGWQLVQVRHVGFAVERDTIQLAAEHENVRTYALTPQSAALDTVRTVAGQEKYLSPRLREFEERRLSKQGGEADEAQCAIGQCVGREDGVAALLLPPQSHPV